MYNKNLFSKNLAKNLLISYTSCLNMIDVELKKWGNSTGIIIPKETLDELGLKPGDSAKIQVFRKKLNGFGIAKGAKPFIRDKDDREF